MVAAISAIGGGGGPDYEYIRILQQLKAIGVAPSGNKSIDKATLERKKTELIEKIHNKQEKKEVESKQVQPIEAPEETKKTQLETLRLGAMNVAELNKIYFGLV